MNMALRYKALRHTLLLVVLIVSLAAAVAFALLQTQSVITGNTISTADANLVVSTDGITYDRTVPGFSFTGLVPGGYPAPSDGYSVYLKNAGDTVLDVNLALDNFPVNPKTADLNKLNITLKDVSAGMPPRSLTVQSLSGDGQLIESELAPGAVKQYKLQAGATNDAMRGATVSNINLAFTGTARDPSAPSQ